MPVRRSASALGPSSVHPPERRRPTAGETVHVRTETVDGVETPAQLLRGDRLWLVRAAELLAGPGRRWRVEAAPGPGAAPVPLELAVADGRWTLAEPSRGIAGEPAWA